MANLKFTDFINSKIRLAQQIFVYLVTHPTIIIIMG